MSARLARRSVLRLIAAAATAPGWLAGCATAAREESTVVAPRSGPAGTLSDPDLVNPVVPWPLTLEEDERATLAVLGDLILPADARLPAASALGAPAFIDEWVSAPWPRMRADAVIVREGLRWLDEEARRRYGAGFRALPPVQQGSIADAICDPATVAPELAAAAIFFDRVRELSVVACYTTPEGMADLGYVGNVALAEWPAPPPEVLRLVGLA